MKLFKLYLALISAVPCAAFAQQLTVTEFTNQVAPNIQGQFIENKGQIVDQYGKARPDVKYIYCAKSFKAIFRVDGISYELYKENSISVTETPAQPGKPVLPKEPEKIPDIQVHRVDMQFEGGNSQPDIITEDRSKAFLSYHIAPNLEPGVTNVHGFAKLTYKNVWPNVDLVFSVKENHTLKYDIVIHPGGRIEDVRLRYNGADDVSLLEEGLRISTSQGVLRESIPRSYLAESGANVKIGYKADRNLIGFTGNFDASQTLIIDPVLAWDSTSASGVTIRHFCRDSKGNLYFTGKSSTTTYIVTSGAYQSTVSGNTDAFLVKIEPSRKILWGTLYGGSSDDEANSVACNDSVVYFAGMTSTSSGLATANAYQTQSGGGVSDVYVVKFSGNGSLRWATYYGDSRGEQAPMAGCDKNGNLYLAGWVRGYYSSTGWYPHMMRVNFSSSGQKISDYVQSGGDESYYTGLSMDKAGKPLYSWYYISPSLTTVYAQASGSGGGYSLINPAAENKIVGGIWPDSAGRVYWFAYVTSISKRYLYKLSSSFKLINKIQLDEVNDIASDKWSNIYLLVGFGRVLKYDSASNLQWDFRLSRTDPTNILTGISDNFYVIASNYVAEYNPLNDLELGKYLGKQNFCYGTVDSIRFEVQNLGDKAINKIKYNVLITDPDPDTISFVDSVMLTLQQGKTTTLKFWLPKDLAPDPYKVRIWLNKDVTNEVIENDTLAFQFDVRDVTAQFEMSDSVVCVGDTITFTDKSLIENDSAKSFTWSINGNTFTGTIMQSSFAQAGTYKIRHTVETPHCSDYAEKTVYVHAYPVPNFTFKFAGNCQGSPVSFTNKTDSSGESTTTYEWDFGDGGKSTDANPSHIYKNTGAYTISLTAKNQPGCPVSVSKSVTIHPLPLPDFSFSKTCMGEVTSFKDASSIPTGYSISSYLWRFGDGQSSTLKNPAHSYISAGSYGVTLITKSSSGCTDSVTKTVDISPRPVAYFTGTSVCLGGQTQFTDQSTISQGSISKYLWIYDGTDTSTSQNPSFTFSTAGTHSVTLITESVSGCRDSVTKQVNVFAVSTVSFTKKTNAGEVTFTASDATLTSYSWSFGDGNTSTSVNPVHTYAAKGTYTIKLTVKNANGCETTVTDTVNINTIGFDENSIPGARVNIYPNPFTKSTTLEYELGKSARTEAKLYDVQGREIATIVRSTRQSAGKYSYTLSAEELKLKAGMYIVRLSIDGKVMNEQVIKLK